VKQEYRLPVPVHDPIFADEAHYAPLVGNEDSLTSLFWHHLRVVRNQIWKIAGFVFAVVAATLLYALQLQPEYEATAILEMESINKSVHLSSDLVAYNYRDEDKVIETQLRLLNNPDIVGAVVRDLRLDRSPFFGYPGKGDPVPVDSLPGLSASMIPSTYLLAIKYRSPSPELCRDIANSVAKAYIQRGYESRYLSTKEMQEWLDRQLEDLRARSERSQKGLLEYEQRHQIVRAADRTDLIEQEVQQLTVELLDVQSLRRQAELKYRALESGDLEDFLLSGEASPLAGVLARRETLELELANLSSRFGPNHPSIKRINDQMERTARLIEKSKEKVLANLQTGYRDIVQREETLRQAYLEKKRTVETLSSLSVEYGILRREAEATTALYEQLLKTVNEVGLQATVRPTTVNFATPAGLPGSPVYPNPRRYVILAFMFSTSLGIGLAILSDFLDRTVRSSDQVEQWLRVPVLANLPRLSGKRKPQTYLMNGAHGGEASQQASQEAHALVESFTMLRTSLLLSAPPGELRVLLIASAAPAEGKSTVAAGLATALAQQVPKGKRVLLIDADLRRPTVHSTFSLDNQFGLSSVLENAMELEDAVHQVENLPTMAVLPRGPATTQSSELLSLNMGRIIERARAQFEYIVIDSAPLLASSDSIVLSTLVDGVVLVARAGDTSRDVVGDAFRQVKRVRANVLGLVLNQVRGPESGSYHYYYYGSYGRENDA
jgi:capsular exopolysaccharide synthesis family protein